MYQLGHGDFYKIAAAQIGADQLRRARAELHAWAQRLRSAGWPADTPEYLLDGYFQMLRHTKDLPAMAECALDVPRQDRMLLLTGGDGAALAELETVRALFGEQQDPDLLTMTRLSVRQDDLRGRNASIPTELPAVWADLGHPVRAESLACGIPDLRRRVSALSQAIPVLAETWSPRRIRKLIDRTRDAADQIIDSDQRVRAQAELVSALIAVGAFDDAEELLTVACPDPQAKRYADLVRAAFAAGDRDRAKRLIVSVADPVRVATLQAITMEEAARQGRYDEVRHIAGKYMRNPERRSRALAELVSIVAADDVGAAQSIAGSVRVDFPYYRVRAHTDLARVMAANGDSPQAIASLAVAEAAVGQVAGTDRRVEALRNLARAWAAAGDEVKASTAAMAIEDPGMRARTLADLVEAADGRAAAVAFAQRAEAAAEAIADPEPRARVLTDLARGVAAAGEPDRAREIVTAATGAVVAIDQPERRAAATVALAVSAAHAGESRAARDLAAAILDPAERTTATAALAEAFTAVGEDDEARATAAAIAGQAQRAKALTNMAANATAARRTGTAEKFARAAEDAARAVDHQDGRRTPEQAAMVRALIMLGEHDKARAVAEMITNPLQGGMTLVAVADAVAATGDHSSAESVARSIDHPFYRSRALVNLVRVLTERDQADRAKIVADAAEEAARQVPDAKNHRPTSLVAVADAVAATGDHSRAESVAGSIDHPFYRSRAMASLVRELAEAEEPARAKAVADAAEEAACQVPDQHHKVQALRYLAEVASQSISRNRAGKLLDAAAVVTRGMPDADQRAQTATELAIAVAHIGDHRRAAALAYSISDRFGRARALSQVSTALAQAGRRQDAYSLARRAQTAAQQVKDFEQRSRALACVMGALASSRPSRAIEVARLAEASARKRADPERARALALLASATATATGDYDRAAALVEQVTLPFPRAQAYADIARAALAAGDYDRVEKLCEAIDRPLQRADMMTALAKALVREDLARAEAVARAIGMPDRQALVLGELAVAAADLGSPERARQLTAQALAMGDWVAALSALAQVDAQATLAVIDERIAHYGEHRTPSPAA